MQFVSWNMQKHNIVNSPVCNAFLKYLSETYDAVFIQEAAQKLRDDDYFNNLRIQKSEFGNTQDPRYACENVIITALSARPTGRAFQSGGESFRNSVTVNAGKCGGGIVDLYLSSFHATSSGQAGDNTSGFLKKGPSGDGVPETDYLWIVGADFNVNTNAVRYYPNENYQYHHVNIMSTIDQPRGSGVMTHQKKDVLDGFYVGSNVTVNKKPSAVLLLDENNIKTKIVAGSNSNGGDGFFVYIDMYGVKGEERLSDHAPVVIEVSLPTVNSTILSSETKVSK